jgi:hypothetical protein
MDIMVFGIDPGTDESGIAAIRADYSIANADKWENELLITKLKEILTKPYDKFIPYIVVESIQSYGMTMGKSTIETCYMIGRIIQVCKDNGALCNLIPRPEYGKAICGSNKVSDTLIRSALENRFGSYDKGKAEKRLKNGTLKQAFVENGPLFLLAGESDKRSAYALAVHFLDVKKYEGKDV